MLESVGGVNGLAVSIGATGSPDEASTPLGLRGTWRYGTEGTEPAEESSITVHPLGFFTGGAGVTTFIQLAPLVEPLVEGATDSGVGAAA